MPYHTGICTEDSYPYTAHEQQCAQDKCEKVKKVCECIYVCDVYVYVGMLLGPALMIHA